MSHAPTPGIPVLQGREDVNITATFWDDQTDTASNTTNCAAVCGYAETIGAWKW